MPNGTTTRPHTVPASYLKFWDKDHKPEKGRDSQIFITNGTACRIDTVKKVCIRKKYYSKLNPNEAEDFFKEYESDYSRLVSTIIKTGQFPSTKESIVLFITYIISFLTRNPTFVHKTNSEERIKNVQIAQEHWWRVFFHPKVRQPWVESEGRKVLNPDFLDSLEKEWGLLILGSPTSDVFTSDNPVSIITTNDSKYEIYFLPISPNYIVGLFSRKSFKKGDPFKFVEINKKDLEKLNQLQAVNANRENYSCKEFSASEIKTYKFIRDKQKLLRNNFIAENEIRYEPFKLPSINYLDFLKHIV
jgi:hypothetical protein